MTVGVILDHGGELFDVIEALYHRRELLHDDDDVGAHAHTTLQLVGGDSLQLAEQLLRFRVPLEEPKSGNE